MLPAMEAAAHDLAGADRVAAKFVRASALVIYAAPCGDAKMSWRAAARRHSLTLR